MSVPTINDRAVTAAVLEEVLAERARQDEKWGEQNHPSGTGPDVQWPVHAWGGAKAVAEVAKDRTDWRAREGGLTYLDILHEEVAEAFAEKDEQALRAELVQVAAVAVQWIEAIDRREAAGAGE